MPPKAPSVSVPQPPPPIVGSNTQPVTRQTRSTTAATATSTVTSSGAGGGGTGNNGAVSNPSTSGVGVGVGQSQSSNTNTSMFPNNWFQAIPQFFGFGSASSAPGPVANNPSSSAPPPLPPQSTLSNPPKKRGRLAAATATPAKAPVVPSTSNSKGKAPAAKPPPKKMKAPAAPAPAAATNSNSTTAAATNLTTAITNAAVVNVNLNNTKNNSLVSKRTSLTTLSASIPIPPDWMEHCEECVASLETYKTFPVAPGSVEYSTINDLCAPLKVLSIEQIVNPELWTRFVNTRKDMFRGKSNNLPLLSKLGLDDKELVRIAHISVNFDQHACIAASPYTDNLALLFHCTRSAANLDNILRQGLDERLGNALSGGLLGRGIYFADNPEKSIAYDGTGSVILVCAVLLGDCLSTDHLASRNAFVREPEKFKEQKRNFNDQFFDSIVGRPGGPNNEYVIYNRYQCLPMYQVKYQRGAGAPGNNNPYYVPRQNLPPVSWIPQPGKMPMPGGALGAEVTWPYHARNIFTHVMGVPDKEEEEKRKREQEEKEAEEAAITAAIIASKESNSQQEREADEAALTAAIIASRETKALMDVGGGDSPSEYAILLERLATLNCLGFTDDVKNTDVLMMYSNDLDRAVNHLLDVKNRTRQGAHRTGVNPATATTSGSTAVAASTSSAATATATNPELIDISAEEDADSSDTRISEESGSEDGELEDLDILDQTDSSSPNSFAFAEAADFVSPISNSNTLPQLLKEDCPICCEEFDYDAKNPLMNNNWSHLACSHKICTGCFTQIEKVGVTMSGVSRTSVKCPFCQGISGIEIGNCPNGVMKVTEIKNPCKGYESFTTWSISYSVSDPKYPLARTAYIPNTDEGRRLLGLLKTAWDQRLCFTIGTSNTTGQENTLVWNIHHKTSLDDKISHGYPDTDYLNRLRLELKSFGIE